MTVRATPTGRQVKVWEQAERRAGPALRAALLAERWMGRRAHQRLRETV